MAVLSESETDIEVKNVPLCRYLEWDSKFFGFHIARVEKEHITPEEMLEILAWCRQKDISCLYFLADSQDGNSIRLVEDYRFNLVDLRVTLERKLDGEIPELEAQNGYKIRPGREDDLPALRQIARSSFQGTRFYFDPHFPRHLCEALYETWIEVSFNGYADVVLVANVETEVPGFITCKVEDHNEGRIALLGLQPGWEGKGIGVALVNAGLSWLSSRQVESVKVVTQGRNIRAQRFYQRCGFRTSKVQLWYHRWLEV